MPERIEEIRKLVMQGIGREEIARALNVTVGSLQVTCSRLGISLRRPTSNGKRHALSQAHEAADVRSAATARLAIVLRRNEKEQVIELALPSGTIAKLALEAQFRSTRIDELLGELVTTAMKQGLFQQVLDGAPPK